MPAGALRTRHIVLAGGLLAVLVAIASWLWNEGEPPASPVAYVLCGNDSLIESRAYRVDLLAGELAGVSGPIEWLGQPFHLAYDRVRSRLYIASMHNRWLRGMWPVTALRARGGEFEVVNRFSTNREENLLARARAGEKPPNKLISEAYRVIVSPDGSDLYVSYSGLSDTGAIMQVWDAETGKILRGLPSVISRAATWSPDGNHVGAIWPSHDREVNKDGDLVNKSSRGGVRVISTRTGEKSPLQHLEDNKGLHPPWGRIDEPLIYLFYWNALLGALRVYDRDTGEVLSELEIHGLTGLDMAGKPEVAVLEGGRLIAVSAVERTMPNESPSPNSGVRQERGYVVLIDVMERREVSRTQVGARCSNAVVAYE